MSDHKAKKFLSPSKLECTKFDEFTEILKNLPPGRKEFHIVFSESVTDDVWDLIEEWQMMLRGDHIDPNTFVVLRKFIEGQNIEVETLVIDVYRLPEFSLESANKNICVMTSEETQE